MTAMEIKINREIRDYKENIFFGLSLRQLIFSLLACGVAAGIFLGLRGAPPSPAAGPPECPGTPSRTYRGTETPHRRRWS